jgi:hypothetical protein
MKYMLLVYADKSKAPKTPEEQAVAQSWDGFGQAAEAAGALPGHKGLSSVSDPTAVRVRDGKMLTTDGPFAETHAQLGGGLTRGQSGRLTRDAGGE